MECFHFHLCTDSTIQDHDGFFFVEHPKWVFCFLCLSMLTTWLLLGIAISTPSATTIFLPCQIYQCIDLYTLLLGYRVWMDPPSSRVHPAYPKCEYEQSIKPLCRLPIKGYVEFDAPAHIHSAMLVAKWWYAPGLPPDVDGRVLDLLDFP